MDKPHIIVVGGGFSGTVVAYQLMKQSYSPISITLFDENGAFAKGLAYSTGDNCHLLNVPAANMSALADDPCHFVRWLKAVGIFRGEKEFYTRSEYSRYLNDLLTEAKRAPGHILSSLELRSEKAIEMIPQPNSSLRIFTDCGKSYEATGAVLALGNFPSRKFDTVFSEKKVLRFPSLDWSESLSTIYKESRVVILGSGLSMIDSLLSLKARGHQGKIISISRRGLVPQAHELNLTSAGIDVSTLEDLVSRKKSPLEWMKFFHSVSTQLNQEGRNWRLLIDSIRPYTNQIWMQWTLRQKKQFLRHLRPFWDVHRHRMSPEVWQRVQNWIKAGEIEILPAKILDLKIQDDKFYNLKIRERRSQRLRTISADVFIDCSGSEENLLSVDNPFLKSIWKNFPVDMDSLGFQFTANGKLVSRHSIYCVGPLRRGHWWETTAVPELRVQAGVVARSMLEDLGEELPGLGGKGEVAAKFAGDAEPTLGI